MDNKALTLWIWQLDDSIASADEQIAESANNWQTAEIWKQQKQAWISQKNYFQKLLKDHDNSTK